MTIDLDKMSKAIDLAIKAEVHALALIAAGAIVAIKGHPDVGQPIIASGLMVFKGNR